MTIRSEEHLRFVRRQPCCVCSHPAPSDAHHFGRGRGTAIKASDLETVPLCRRCHTEWHRRRACPPWDQQATELLFWRTACRMIGGRMLAAHRVQLDDADCDTVTESVNDP